MTEVAPSFHELSFVVEGDEVVVGRVDTGEFVVLPVDGAELLRRMSEGMSPTLAAEWYLQTYDEAVDISDFLASLDELGFVRAAGDSVVLPAVLRFRQLAVALFSPVAALCYSALVVWWVVLLHQNADLFPRSSQIFFTGSLVLVQIVITFGQVPLLFLHEGAHVLAGQRIGLASGLDVSNRLTYVVFETKLNGLLSVPRRHRYLPFIAGILVDIIVLAAFGVIADLTRTGDGHFSFTGRLCLGLGFTVLMRVAWQFQLYLRTDLYFVFSTALNCFDLHDASKAIMRNRLRRWLGRDQDLVDESQWTDHDLRVGRWYGPFLLLGVLATVSILIFGSAPVIGHYFTTIWRNIGSGRVDGPFWDSVSSLSFNVAQLVTLAVLARRKRRQAAARAPRLLAS